ncbi:MAG: DNA-packaging protein [Oscillospiraceae bacterium]|nr:DNA-packaging protein [Oscillospiraceae bacterium]
MLDKVKLALRLTTDAFDAELTDLINAAALDLGLVGIAIPELLANDALIVTAIVTYVRCHFGSPSDYDRLKASYDEQKAQLQTATGYGL